MKCITHNCPNCSDQGVGRAICVEPDDDGWICEPCWNFLTTGRGRVNQICTNSKKANAPTIVADESEQMGVAAIESEHVEFPPYLAAIIKAGLT